MTIRRATQLTLLAMTAVCAFGAATSAQNGAASIPRTADGKPDFTGTYQWPTYLQGDERGRSSATTFDRKRFAPLKPGGEAFLEPRTGDPGTTSPATSACPPGFLAECFPRTRCSSSRRRIIW